MSKRLSTSDYDVIGEIVPELRFTAGRYRSTPAAIDDLVELTLRTAVAERATKPADVPLSLWLRRIMIRIVLH